MANMKRFGMYNNDFTSLFECYGQVTGVISERKLPTRKSVDPNLIGSSGGVSFDDVKQLRIQKIQNRRPVEDQISKNYVTNDVSVVSDDGVGGVVLTGETRDGYVIHVTVVNSEKAASIVVTRDGSEVERLEARETNEVANPIVFNKSTITINYDLEPGSDQDI